MIKCNGKDVIPRINGKELSRVMYNGKQIYPANNNNVIEIQLADVVAGDVCAFDGTNKRFFRFVNSGATDDIKKYTPIGVVVIPASHDVYGTGECGVMSLKTMSCTDPENGSSDNSDISSNRVRMSWGVYGTDIESLPNLDQAPIVGSGSNVGDESSTVIGKDSNPFLPSDNFNAIQCPHDTDTYYHDSSTSSYTKSPSPYLTDGSRNPAYYQIDSPSSTSNCLADFDGRGNTQKILEVRGEKDYSSWKPTYNIQSDYPAASCCDMFHTEGTSQGDWYLPAMGELGYIMPPFNKISETITNLINSYSSSVGVKLSIEYGSYSSSTEYTSIYPRFIYIRYGGVYGYTSKGGLFYVRAFLRVRAS